jgi:two-component system sensor histidine kinase HydH
LDKAIDSGVDKGLAHQAIDKICDLEVAIMLETYSDHHGEQMRGQERLATLGQVAGFVGHELRNPLAVMETSLYLLSKRVPAEEEKGHRHLRRLSQQVTLSSSIISGLLELTRDRPLDREHVDLAETIGEILEGIPGVDQITVETDLEPDVSSVFVDRQYLRHLISNLVTNALQAVVERGTVGTVWIHASGEGTTLRLVVEDDGPGLAPEVMDELFKPLRTTRVKGLGLGLALCSKIVERHGGGIDAGHREGGGARFEVRLEEALGEQVW